MADLREAQWECRSRWWSGTRSGGPTDGVVLGAMPAGHLMGYCGSAHWRTMCKILRRDMGPTRPAIGVSSTGGGRGCWRASCGRSAKSCWPGGTRVRGDLHRRLLRGAKRGRPHWPNRLWQGSKIHGNPGPAWSSYRRAGYKRLRRMSPVGRSHAWRAPHKRIAPGDDRRSRLRQRPAG
jgi:hypothetical protein